VKDSHVFTGQFSQGRYSVPAWKPGGSS